MDIKGVTFSKNGYVASVRRDSHTHYLGRFKTEAEAAKAILDFERGYQRRRLAAMERAARKLEARA